ncbi:MAG: urease accessory protein ureD [Cyanobium sp. CACIAM 14]|nr:MAG: urease accessory protein ureD [Cyanobium sp. CACIAM 14]
MGDTGSGWSGRASLRFSRGEQGTCHQGGATAPLKIQRAFRRADGRCELPILHTAGGLVGGDRLSISASLEPGSRVLLTSVAAQKVYGSIGRSRQAPAGRWARQELAFDLETGADLEWLPQELVLYAGGLFEQRTRVTLAPEAGWLGGEVVRLGRTAAGEGLGEGRWRSLLEIRRRGPRPGDPDRWELVDRLALGGASLEGPHGMAGEPVFGSLVWAAPGPLPEHRLRSLLEECRRDRRGLEGTMVCGPLDQGLVARYRGASSTDARGWFSRIWARLRALQGLGTPEIPRVWPFQEHPLGGSERKVRHEPVAASRP